MAYKRKTQPTIVSTETISDERSRYMVTDSIEGNINNKYIKAVRGQILRLTPEQYNVFKEKVLLIYED